VIPLQAGVGKIFVIETIFGSVESGNEVVELVAADAGVNPVQQILFKIVYYKVLVGMIIRYECTVYFYDRQRQRQFSQYLPGRVCAAGTCNGEINSVV